MKSAVQWFKNLIFKQLIIHVESSLIMFLTLVLLVVLISHSENVATLSAPICNTEDLNLCLRRNKHLQQVASVIDFSRVGLEHSVDDFTELG